MDHAGRGAPTPATGTSNPVPSGTGPRRSRENARGFKLGHHRSFSWLDLDGVYNYNQPAWWGTPTGRPWSLLEAQYEGETGAQGISGTVEVRTTAYAGVLLGGYGAFFGNSPIWFFGSGWQAALGSAGSRSMAAIASVFSPRRWDLLVRDDGSFLTAGSGSTNDWTGALAARASDGSWGAVYVPTGRTVTLSMGGFAGSVSAKWIDPTTGTIAASSGPLANAGSQSFSTPGTNAGGDGDWILVLE